MTVHSEVLRARLLANRRINGECWEWTRSCRSNGYGQTSVDGGRRNVAVHRLAAALWLGFDLDSELLVLHECDNRICFNPGHLFVGTAADNTADMMSKGRWKGETRRGEEHTRHVLTAEQVLDIRRIADEANHARGIYAQIARDFGISGTLARRIALRLNWSHL